jgi:hypothetical protein
VTARLQPHKNKQYPASCILEVKYFQDELIGEFTCKNTGWRVLSRGKIETSSQGAGEFFGVDAFVVSTATGVMANGVFRGKVRSLITTKDGDTIWMRGTAVAYPQAGGGFTRAATIQLTQSPKLAHLNKVVCLQEFQTDMTDNWVGKIWQWK